jgi:hypothetical protein
MRLISRYIWNSCNSTTKANLIKQWVLNLNRHFSKESTQMPKRHRNKIKTTMICHCGPVRMTVSFKKGNQMFMRLYRNETLVHCCKTRWSLRKTVWQFFQKVNVGLPYDSAIVPPGVLSKEIKARTRIVYRDVHSSSCHKIAKLWKQSNISNT